MISLQELAEMRSVCNGSMPDLCNIQKQVLSSDNAGGQAITWTNETTGVACRIVPYILRSEEKTIGARQAELRMWTVALPFGTSVDGSRRIQATTMNGAVLSTLRLFRIEMVEDGSFCVQLQLKCTEIPAPSA